MQVVTSRMWTADCQLDHDKLDKVACRNFRKILENRRLGNKEGDLKILREWELDGIGS